MIHASRTTGGCLSLFPLPWKLGWKMPGQAFTFSVAQNPDPLQIISFCLESYPHPQKTLYRHAPYWREGPEVVHSWYRQLLLCWEAAHWGEKSKRKYIILVQWILTYHKIFLICICTYVCMYVNSTCHTRLHLGIIFPPAQYFAAIFLRDQPLNILDYGACCSYSYIRDRTKTQILHTLRAKSEFSESLRC